MKKLVLFILVLFSAAAFGQTQTSVKVKTDSITSNKTQAVRVLKSLILKEGDSLYHLRIANDTLYLNDTYLITTGMVISISGDTLFAGGDTLVITGVNHWTLAGGDITNNNVGAVTIDSTFYLPHPKSESRLNKILAWEHTTGNVFPASVLNLIDTINQYMIDSNVVGSTWLRDTTNGYIYEADTTDRVGIGTTTPDEMLDVIGNAKVSGTISAGLDSASTDYSIYYNKVTGLFTYDSAATGGTSPAGVDSIDVIEHEQFPIDYLRYQKNSVWDTVTNLIRHHGVMYGGYVSWIADTTFWVESCLYFLYGVMYTTPDTEIKINSGDDTNPRIDLVVVNDDTTVSVIEGTPASDPAAPMIDPLTQLELTQIYVPAGATSFDTIIYREIIYNENVEWTGSASGVTVDFGDATSPFVGDSCVNVGTLTNNDEIIFTNDAAVAYDLYDVFAFAIKLKEVLTSFDRVYVQFYDGALAVTNAVWVNANTTSLNWQTYSVNLSSFAWTGSEYDKVVFRYLRKTGNFDGFYLDYLKVERGTSTPTYNNNIILSGDITGTGVTGSPVVTTLSTVNSNVGTFGSADSTIRITVDAKGRVLSVTKYLAAIPASVLEWSDTTAAGGVGIATYADLQDVTGGSLTWADTTATAGVGIATYADLLTKVSKADSNVTASYITPKYLTDQAYLTEETDPVWIADSADFLRTIDTNSFVASHKWVEDKNYLTVLPASAVEWSDTTASAGVGIGTFDDIRDTAAAIRADLPVGGGLAWSDTTATAGVGLATYYDISLKQNASTALEWADTTAAAGVGIATYSDISLLAPKANPTFTGTVTVASVVTTTGTSDLSLSGASTGIVEVNDAAKFNTSAGYDAVTNNTITANATTINWTAGNVQSLTYNDTCTFTFTAPPLPCHLTLKMTHAANTTVFPCTWPTGANGVVWAGGTAITPTATSGAVDIVSFLFDGTKYYGMFGTDFK